MANHPIRILNLFTIMDCGGAETMVMNYFRNIDRTKVQFDFMVHREERGVYDDEIERLGGNIYRMPQIRPWSSNSYRKAVRNFYASHPEYRIIHSHMSELGIYDFIEAEKQGVPCRICHAHNRPYGIDLKSPVRWYYKTRMIPYITHMFICGKESGDWLFGKKNESQFIQMNNAIDAKRYSYDAQTRQRVRERLGIVSSQPVVGHIGRFSAQKNHTFILDIFQRVLKTIPDALLLLIGDHKTEIGAQMIDKAEKLKIDRQVRFLGVCDDIPDLLNAMDVFLFPSLFEGLSVASIEAQAAGLPCLISDKVPLECKKTDLVKQIPLSASPERWAEAVVEAAKTERRNTYQEIASAGFDIKENAEWLENFYFHAANGE